MGSAERFDIAILGTGIAGTTLGAILAKNGLRVLLIDEASHPRFAIGEATTPHGSMLTRIMAARYGVPEIADCAFLHTLQRNVTSACGIKRNFGFVYHRAGEEQRQQEVTQSIFSVLPYGPEIHLYRQDVDAHLLFVAIRHGASVRQQTSIQSIDIDDRGVHLGGSRGEQFVADYLVDATGYRSVLSQRFQLRESPTRMRTHSRSLFTHMIGVQRYEQCEKGRTRHKVPFPWSEGTLHHIFDGGWLWVIPFNNHRASSNPLCSVGLNLDTRRFPKSSIEPEAEFNQFLARFPSLRPQFADAKAVRAWVATDRVQYSSRKCFGDRYCLLAHASAFVDPLFSRGLANNAEVINSLAARLLAAFAERDFSAKRFEYVERLQQTLYDYNDRLVNCAYVSFSDFELWRAWYRVWAVGSMLGSFRLNRAFCKYLESGDTSYLCLDNADYPGLMCPDLGAFKVLFERAAAEVEAVEEGRIASGVAAARVVQLLEETDFAPSLLRSGLFRFKTSRWNLVSKYYPTSLLRLLAWGRLGASDEIKTKYFDYGARPIARLCWNYFRDKSPIA